MSYSNKNKQVFRYCIYCGKKLNKSSHLYNEYYCSNIHKMVDNRLDYRLFYNKSSYDDIKNSVLELQLEEIEMYFDNIVGQMLDDINNRDKK